MGTLKAPTLPHQKIVIQRPVDFTYIVILGRNIMSTSALPREGSTGGSTGG